MDCGCRSCIEQNDVVTTCSTSKVKHTTVAVEGIILDVHLKGSGAAPLPVVDVDIVVAAVQRDAFSRAGRTAHGRRHQVPGDTVSNAGSGGAAAEVPEVVGGVVGSVQGGDIGGGDLQDVRLGGGKKEEE